MAQTARLKTALDQKHEDIEERFRRTEQNRNSSQNQWLSRVDQIKAKQKQKEESLDRMREKQRVQSLLKKEIAEFKRETSNQNFIRLTRVDEL